MRDIQKELAEDYQEFFNFLNQEHNLILTISEMDEVVFEAQKLVKKLSLGVVVGQSEQLVCSCGSRLVKTTGGYHCGNAKCSV